jgi:hypothetical protein
VNPLPPSANSASLVAPPASIEDFQAKSLASENAVSTGAPNPKEATLPVSVEPNLPSTQSTDGFDSMATAPMVALTGPNDATSAMQPVPDSPAQPDSLLQQTVKGTAMIDAAAQVPSDRTSDAATLRQSAAADRGRNVTQPAVHPVAAPLNDLETSADRASSDSPNGMTNAPAKGSLDETAPRETDLPRALHVASTVRVGSSTGPASSPSASKSTDSHMAPTKDVVVDRAAVPEPDHAPDNGTDHAAPCTSEQASDRAPVRSAVSAPDQAGNSDVISPSVNGASITDSLSAQQLAVNFSSSAVAASPAFPATARATNPAELSSAAGTNASTPNLSTAASYAGDDAPSDSGKNQSNRDTSSFADRKDSRAPSSPLNTPAVETLKIEPVSATAPSAQAAAVGPAAPNAPASASLPALPSEGHTSAAPSGTHADAVPPTANIPPLEVAALAARSDVKIAMQGSDFGHIELHAKMAGEEVSATITVERHDAHAILAGDLPALHQALNDRQLRVSEILLLHNTLSSGGASDDGANAQRDEQAQRQANAHASARSFGEGSLATGSAPSARTTVNGIFDSSGRLSVRA